MLRTPEGLCICEPEPEPDPIDRLVDEHLWVDWDPNERVVMRVDRPVDPALMAQALADEYLCPVNRRGQHCPFHDTMRGLRHAR